MVSILFARPDVMSSNKREERKDIVNNEKGRKSDAGSCDDRRLWWGGVESSWWRKNCRRGDVGGEDIEISFSTWDTARRLFSLLIRGAGGEEGERIQPIEHQRGFTGRGKSNWTIEKALRSLLQWGSYISLGKWYSELTEYGWWRKRDYSSRITWAKSEKGEKVGKRGAKLEWMRGMEET